MSLSIAPMTITAAKQFVSDNHRHHKPPVGALFAIGLSNDGALCGVAIVGRPVARMLQDGVTAEVIRLCTDGTRNACSMLYGAAWRAARALGYSRLITYTLPEEGGASLRGAGWTLVGQCGGGSWDRQRRPRIDKHPTQAKHRYEAIDSAISGRKECVKGRVD